MKLRTLKAHYFENKYKRVGDEYVADIQYGESAVKRGNCEKIELPTRADKIKEAENKKHPKTRKGKLNKK